MAAIGTYDFECIITLTLTSDPGFTIEDRTDVTIEIRTCATNIQPTHGIYTVPTLTYQDEAYTLYGSGYPAAYFITLPSFDYSPCEPVFTEEIACTLSGGPSSLTAVDLINSPPLDSNGAVWIKQNVNADPTDDTLEILTIDMALHGAIADGNEYTV